MEPYKGNVWENLYLIHVENTLKETRYTLGSSWWKQNLLMSLFLLLQLEDS